MVIIPLTQGKTAIIDDADAELVKNFKWSAARYRNTWYARAAVRRGYADRYNGIKNKKEIVYLHRILMGLGPNKEVDHIDGNGLNCRRKNMRESTHSQNMKNQRMRINNNSGFRGVTFDKARNKWKASIVTDMKNIFIGRFATAVDAARAYNVASLNHHGEFGYRNLIPH